MARRIDIELTSRRDDGTWTWRAPGARQPRGSLEGALLPEGATVGDVLRADAEFEIDGIVVTAVLAPKADVRKGDLDRIEVIGSGRDRAPAGVSVVLAPGGRRRDDGGSRGLRPRRDGAERDTERTDGGRRADRRGRREHAGPDERGGGRRGPKSDRAGALERGARGEKAPGDEAVRTPARGARTERGERPRRLQPVSAHRNAALADLRPEQLPVAEQLLRGGIPAVRHAIEEQNARARSEGRAEVSAEPLLAMAEELLPRVNLASWKDRAVAARNAGKDAPLREMRSVVAAASTVTLDDEGREMQGALREALQARVTALRDGWTARIVAALDDDRVGDALRVSSRPPEPAARVPAELAVRLAESAGSAMSPSVDEAGWLSLLDAVVSSPVRRTVKPAGLPTDAGDEFRASARRAAGQVPEVARLLGLPIPPPPGPRRAAPSGTR